MADDEAPAAEAPAPEAPAAEAPAPEVRDLERERELPSVNTIYNPAKDKRKNFYFFPPHTRTVTPNERH